MHFLFYLNRFGLPSHWNRKQGKRSPGLSGLRSHLYQVTSIETISTLLVSFSTSKSMCVFYQHHFLTYHQESKSHYPQLQNFRFHPNLLSQSLVQKRAPSFWEGAGEEEGRWLHKRAAVEEGEVGGVWPLNSVPFMGKRTLEVGEGGPGGQGMVLVRVPREEQEDTEEQNPEEPITNPWDFLLLDPHRIWSHSSKSETGNKIKNVWQALEMM